MKKRKDIKWGEKIESENLFPIWKRDLEKRLSSVVQEERLRDGFNFSSEILQMEA